MGERGLLSRLQEGEYSSQRADPVGSITEHLRALLNTRQGDSGAEPGYGILDFNDVVHTLPSALHRMQDSIRQAIQAFEPRLKNVAVVHLEDEADPSALRFEITAQLVQKGARGTLRFHTRVRAGGQIELW